MAVPAPTNKRERGIARRAASAARRAERRKTEMMALPKTLARGGGAWAGQKWMANSKVGEVPTAFAAEGVTLGLSLFGIGVPWILQDAIHGWAIGELAVWQAKRAGNTNILPW